MANPPHPSDAELLLLHALWQNPRITVQQVHEWLESHEKQVAYTTVLTQLQRMYKKGLVDREKEGKQHLYTAVPQREEVERRSVERLRSTVFGGSNLRLALRALGESDGPDAAELDELQRWLDTHKKKGDD